MDWAKYGKVIASEYRKKILASLGTGPRTPKQIARDTGIYLSHVSHTLNELTCEGIVECLTPELKRGKIFALSEEGKEILDQLKKMGE